jgi:ABC-type lipoprotein release transport system permease subunit
MWLIKLSWKNLWRNRSRTAVTISAMFFAVVLSITTSSLQDGVFDHFIRNMVGYYTGYIQIHKMGYWEQQILDNSMEQSAEVEKNIKDDPNISALAPRIESYALASAGELTKGCMVIGISPREENHITSLQSKVVQGSYFDENNSQTVLIAEGLAERLNVQLHDSLILISQGYHGSLAAGKYLIQGVVHFGSPDLNDQLLYMPLNTAQEFYSAPGLLTSYVLSIESSDELDESAVKVRSFIGSDYEVMTWEELLPEVEQHIKTDKGSMYIIQSILYLLICFGIFGTLLMMIAERKFEMGMLIAIGMKKKYLMLVLMMESVMNVIIGCLAGCLASFPLVYYLKVNPIRFGGDMAKMYAQYGFEPVFPASVNPMIFLAQGIIVLCVGLVLSLYPIIKVIQLDPVKAMKK